MLWHVEGIGRCVAAELCVVAIVQPRLQAEVVSCEMRGADEGWNGQLVYRCSVNKYVRSASRANKAAGTIGLGNFRET